MSTSDTASRATFPPLDPRHDLRHELASQPKARESVAYMMQLPDEGIFISFYTWISREGVTGRAFSAVGPGVGETVLEHVEGVEGGADQDFDDWSVAGMKIRHTDLLRTAEISFSGDDVQFACTFEATSPAYAHSHTPQRGGHPPFVATDRLEQPGRAVGSVTLRGREVAFDTFMHRDHSWGVRNWSLIQHWKWFTAETDAGAVYAFEIFGLGRKWLYGYVDRDGLIARITDAEIDVDYDDDQMQRSARFVLVDDADRTTTVEAETYAIIAWPPDPKTVLHEAGMRARIEGHDGVGHLGMAWSIDYLDSVRQARAAGADI